jgi:predicted dehydrogenase
MRIAIVGCGYVADLYLGTLCNYPHLVVAGVMDRDQARAKTFAEYWRVGRIYATLQEVLDDPSIELVVNLTNPASHFSVSKACILADKHVYSEKPLAMSFADAKELVELAEARGLKLSGAPCGILGEAAQTVLLALERQAIGKIFLAYVEMDDGMIHRERYRTWRNPGGAYWPYKDEFECGCTLEHAGYSVTWLVWFFGRVRRLTAFSSCRIEDKQTDVPLDIVAPDFSVACLEFESGMVARLTCSIVAPHDRSLTIIGEQGELYVKDVWDYQSPVFINRVTRLRRWGSKYPILKLLAPGVAPTRLRLVKGAKFTTASGVHATMDFARGVAEIAAAITENRKSRISARFTLHINEVVLAMQSPDFARGPYSPVSYF